MKKIIYIITNEKLVDETLLEIKLLKNDFNIFLFIYNIDIQTNTPNTIKIVNQEDLISEIYHISPYMIIFKDIPELTFDFKILQKIYDINRKYYIIEYPKQNDYIIDNKLFFPDRFIFNDIKTNLNFLNLDVPTSYVSSIDKTTTKNTNNHDIKKSNVLNNIDDISVIINYKDDNKEKIRLVIDNLDYFKDIKICFSTKDDEEELYKKFTDKEIEQYTFIQYEYLPDKTSDDQYYWDNVSRYIGMRYSDKKWLLFINSDEIILHKSFKEFYRNTNNTTLFSHDDSPLLIRKTNDLTFFGDRKSINEQYNGNISQEKMFIRL